MTFGDIPVCVCGVEVSVADVRQKTFDTGFFAIIHKLVRANGNQHHQNCDRKDKRNSLFQWTLLLWNDMIPVNQAADDFFTHKHSPSNSRTTDPDPARRPYVWIV